MRQLPASVVPQQLLVTSYWPRLQADGENIGFGVSRNYILYRTLFFPFQRFPILLIEPRLRTKYPLPVRILMLGLPSSLIGTFVTRRGWLRNSRGYYVLDDEGKALSFLGYQMPESINGRMGMGRKKFLRMLVHNN